MTNSGNTKIIVIIIISTATFISTIIVSITQTYDFCNEIFK